MFEFDKLRKELNDDTTRFSRRELVSPIALLTTLYFIGSKTMAGISLQFVRNCLY